jgi:hypothetical protein
MNSINYYKKYIKYKNKYLEIKSQIGGIPLRDIIFQIHQIEDPEMNLYLNPLFGFVYYSNGFIFNYKYFYSETSIGKILNEKDLFNEVGNVIKPSNFFSPNITCKEIGIITGLLYLLYIEKNKECTEEMLNMYPIYKKRGESKQSKKEFNKYNKLFYNSFKEAENEEILADLFRLLLIILWWKIENLDNIREYFEGVKHVIPSLILIKDTDETTEFKTLFIKTATVIELTEMGQLKHFCTDVVYIDSGIIISEETYPNCGENVLNNLFNIIRYFYGENFVKKLEDLCANPKLTNYYSKKYDSIDEWSNVVSNLNNVKYNRKGIKEGSEYKFEIKSGFSLIPNKLNILQVISELIPDVNSWEDFISKFNKSNISIEIETEIDSNGNGKIIIHINDLIFKINLMAGHYEIVDDINPKSTVIEFNHIKKEYLKNLIQINLRKINENIEENFKYIKWKNKLLVNLVFKNKLSDILYTKIINYFIDHLTNDEYEQIYYQINFDKIIDIDTILKKIKIFTFNEENINFLSKTTNLIKLNITYKGKLCNSLFMLTTLKELELKFYDIPLDDSLSMLTGLNKLYLNSYTQPLDDSLSIFTGLNILNLHSYNELLGNSLYTLIGLYKLNLNNYDKPLGDSLSKLTALKQLYLNSYNQSLCNSLFMLIAVNELHLNSYDIDLNDSLSMLTNLKKLYLNRYKKPLNDSLLMLTSLNELHLNKINIPLNNSLSTLTNLNELRLHNYNQPLNNSLFTLTNLNELRLYSYNQLLCSSLSTLVKLKILYLNNYEEPLNSSLSTLINLDELYLNKYNILLEESLSTLTNLNKLELRSYNKINLRNNLSMLTNLKSLSILESMKFRRDGLEIFLI